MSIEKLTRTLIPYFCAPARIRSPIFAKRKTVDPASEKVPRTFSSGLQILTDINNSICAPARIRTWDPISISDVLYQLSYTRISMVRVTLSKKRHKNKKELKIKPPGVKGWLGLRSCQQCCQLLCFIFSPW